MDLQAHCSSNQITCLISSGENGYGEKKEEARNARYANDFIVIDSGL